MSTELDTEISDMCGNLALPRSNGELVFAAPWEGRAFGIAVTLNESGLYEWGDFQRRLADAIANADHEDYYECWLASLERLLVEYGVITADEIDRRTDAYEHGELDD